jgi:hypothetical protein
VPSTFINITGDFKTNCYLRDSDGCADDSGARITRLFIGAQQCLMIDSITSELYQDVTQNLIRCKVNNMEVGYLRASMLVSNSFGRAFLSQSINYVSPDEHVYNFHTYPGK